MEDFDREEAVLSLRRSYVRMHFYFFGTEFDDAGFALRNHYFRISFHGLA